MPTRTHVLDRRRPLAIVAVVALIAALAFLVPERGASGQAGDGPITEPGTLSFVASGSDAAFVFTGVTQSGSQTISTVGGCNADTGDDSLVLITAGGGVPSFRNNGLAVRSQGEGGGTRSPCAYINGPETLTLALAGRFDAMAIASATLDVEAKSGVTVRADLYLDGSFVTSVSQSTDPSDSGPDSADNVAWSIDTGDLFDEIRFYLAPEDQDAAKGFAIETGADVDAITGTELEIVPDFEFSGTIDCDTEEGIPDTFDFGVEPEPRIAGQRLPNLVGGADDCTAKNWFGNSEEAGDGGFVDYVVSDVTQVAAYTYDLTFYDVPAQANPAPTSVDYGDGAVSLPFCDGLTPVIVGGTLTGFQQIFDAYADGDPSEIASLDQSGLPGMQFSCTYARSFVQTGATTMDLTESIYNIGDLRYFR